MPTKKKNCEVQKKTTIYKYNRKKKQTKFATGAQESVSVFATSFLFNPSHMHRKKNRYENLKQETEKKNYLFFCTIFYRALSARTVSRSPPLTVKQTLLIFEPERERNKN